jgi:TldD protein
MRISCVTVLILLADASFALAGSATDKELKSDVLLRALVGELDRSQTDVRMDDLPDPYFIEYALVDALSVNVSADLGATANVDERRIRFLRTEVRVGSYEMDNTNFQGGFGGFGGFGRGGRFGSVPVPIEDDYDAIRQAIWWATDREYKRVVEDLEKKKAFVKTKMIEDRPNDLSHEEPVEFFEDREKPEFDVDQLQTLADALSAVFRDYDKIQNSHVNVNAMAGNQYLVNTEGTRMRTSGVRLLLSATASTQCADGMPLSDTFSVYAMKRDGLPAIDTLVKKCRKMCDELITVSEAPVLEAYTGPVLFEAPAAASVFSQRFARRFIGGQRPLGSRTNPSDFAKKLGKRVLPRFLDVVDDPTRETILDQPVLGHYKYDDQGVKARKVQLVEGGQLKALLMSRNPSKEFDKSTGHGRGTFRPAASIGCLIVSARDGADEKTLRAELIEAFEDEGLDYGIRVESLGRSDGGGSSAFAFQRRRGGTIPLTMYKVFPDGREERVRGAEIAGISTKAFKRLLAAGDKPFVLNSRSSGGSTIVAPAMLFEELDLAKIDRDFDQPPILTNPVGRASVD